MERGKRPDFFLVGAAKSGTTSIFRYLVQHPEIYIPEIKEPNYFSDYRHPRAPRLAGIDDYLALFDACPDGCLAGDASTSYLYSPRAAGRIRELNPDARILAILRNPVDRAYSFYWHNRRELAEDLPFEAALDAEPERIRNDAPFRYHYVASGKYADQVARYLDVFGEGAVSIHLFEDLERDAAGLCRDIFEFLGLRTDVEVDTTGVYNPAGPVRNRALAWILNPEFPARPLIRAICPRFAMRAKHRLMRLNVKPPPPMDPDTRRRLEEEFEEDIERLEVLIGRRLNPWRDGIRA